MKRLSGSKKVFAVASAVFLVAAASSTALAMIDHGFGSVRNQQGQRQIQQDASGQAQQSPLPTPPTTPGSHSNETEFRGTVEVIAATGWVVGGRAVQVTGATEIDAGIDVGSEVKIHAQVQADSSLVAREIELVNASDDEGNDNGNGNENENDDNNNNGNENSNDDDDNGNGNSNDNDDDDDDNNNGNVNSNDDEHDDDDDNDNGNVNSNDDEHDDDDDNDNDDNNDDNHGGDDDHGNSNDDHGGSGDD